MDAAAFRLKLLAAHLQEVDTMGVVNGVDSAATSATIWKEVPQAPPDSILGITEAYKADSHPDKLNLGVGAYRTEEGKPLVLNCVHKAEQQLVNDASRDKEYIPIGGFPQFCQLAARLALGVNSPVLREGRNATVQALSGTGALRVGGEFLRKHYHVGIVYVPNPTWGNHNAIFKNAGLEVRSYRYYHPKTRGLDYEGMLEDLGAAPDGSVVILHACAHNPTGVDPSLHQWGGILNTMQHKHMLPFFDSAYQGFASGDLDQDAASIRMFAEAGMEFLLAQSFAKNMGLYGERVGALTVVCRDKAVVGKVESQLKQVIRPMYSSPPRHGASLVIQILTNPQLTEEWKVELREMADRIHHMRQCLYDELKKCGAPGEWDHVLKQIGMFSFTGLTKPQCERMASKWHIYMTMDGRISMAGLSAGRAPYLAAAIKDCVTSA